MFGSSPRFVALGLLPAVVMATGCADSPADNGAEESVDTAVGPTDSGTHAADTAHGAVDTGPVDVGATDAGHDDAGVADVGAMDSGALDAGGHGEIDALNKDAGPSDAGIPDSADPPADAIVPADTTGALDGGTQDDAAATGDTADAAVVTDVEDDDAADAEDVPVVPPTICAPGAYKCADASKRLVCNPAGTAWLAKEDCSASKATCLAGACVPWKCTPKATACSKDGKGLEVCDATGQLTVDFPCPAAHSCVAGACKKQLCAPTKASCKGNVVHTCDALGMTLSKTKDCGEDLCVDGACKKKVCAKGAASCASDVARKVCNATQTGFDVLPCGSGQVCTKGACAAVVCKPKAARCVGKKPLVCNATGTEWTELQTCGAKQACSNGACVQLVCEPNKKVCDGHTAKTCAGDGLAWASKVCSDDNACTSDSCDAKSGTCSFGPAKPCKSDTVCSIGACDAKTGTCLFVPQSGACDDGDKCTAKDTCSGGKCAAGKVVACDDGNACTQDLCDTATGKCASKPMASGQSCATGSVCSAGVCRKRICKPKALRCAGDEVQRCDLLGTSWKADTNCAAQNKTCAAGHCVAPTCTAGARLCHKGQLATCNPDGKGYTTRDCDDGNACTTDVCGGQPLDCAHPATKTCDDGFGCTHDLCDTLTGVCSNPTKKGACDDKKDCTTDVCSAKTGKCEHQPAAATTPCNDGDVCTTDDKCGTGTCAGTKRTCSDGDPCTVDGCKADGSCVHTDAKDGAPCADNHPCVGKGTCKGGTCTAKSTCSWQPVYSDSIDCGASGWVLKTLVGNGTVGWGIDATSNSVAFYSKWCSLNFNNGSSYATGSRVAGTATSKPIKLPAGHHLRLLFRDYNGVENAKHRDHRIVEISDDGFAKRVTTARLDNHIDRGKWALRSLVIDPMFAGKAIQLRLRFDSMDGKDNGGPGWYVDDLQVLGAKIGAKSCKGAADCGDGDPCTTDTCASGACQHTSDAAHALCDDGDPCSWDTCKAQVGCVHGPTYATCDDNNACTSSDNCLTGTCTGVAKSCDDANSCTADSCDPKTGACSHKAQKDGSKCEDNSKCTVGDICKDGACGGPAKTCKDGVGCTLDSCDPATGGCIFPTDPAVCGDGKVCTEDVCDVKTGTCSSTPRPNCCTQSSQCTDGVSCTTDVCDLKANECVFTATASACNDNNACTTDACDLNAKKCTHIAIKGCCTGKAQCDDKNPCTIDNCTQNKCTYTNTGCQLSCYGRCGKYQSGAKCQCDTLCGKFNDCCTDYKKLCG